MSELGLKIADFIGDATLSKTVTLGVENARKNRPFFDKTINELEGAGKNEKGAIVVVGRPSLHRRESVARIKEVVIQGT